MVGGMFCKSDKPSIVIIIIIIIIYCYYSSHTGCVTYVVMCHHTHTPHPAIPPHTAAPSLTCIVLGHSCVKGDWSKIEWGRIFCGGMETIKAAKVGVLGGGGVRLEGDHVPFLPLHRCPPLLMHTHARKHARTCTHMHTHTSTHNVSTL